MAVLYHVNGSITISIIVFEKGWTDAEQNAESLRAKRVTVTLKEPIPGSGLDFEMLLFLRSLEILRTHTITQNSPHTIYFKNLNMARRLYGQNCKFFTTPLCRIFLKSLEHKNTKPI